MRTLQEKNNNRYVSAKFKFIISMLFSCFLFELALAADEPSQIEGGPLLNPLFENFTPVTDAMLQNPDPADWLMWRRTLNSWGHSPLDQINADNVDELRMVWIRGLDDGIQEGTALVHDGIMFFSESDGCCSGY